MLPPRLFQRLGDRLAPNNLVGETIAAQVASMGQLPPAGVLLALDPGLTLYSSPAPAEGLTPGDHAALFASSDSATPLSFAGQYFAYFDTPPAAPTAPQAPSANPPGASPTDPSAPANTQAGNAGGSTSLVNVPTTPPFAGVPQAPPPPPPVVPPPNTNPPTPPHANADGYNVVGGTIIVSAATGVLANDTNPTGQPMTAQLVSQTAFGAVSLTADGAFVYTTTANPGVAFTDSFSYQAIAGGSTSNTATVTLNIAGPAAPTANDDSYAVNNGALAVQASGVLANDTNPGTLPMTATMVAFASNGTAVLHSDGSFTYAANAGFTGTDSFTYRVTAGGSPSNFATVTLHVTPAGPVANADAYTVTGGTLAVAASGVLVNDTNPTGQTMTATLVDMPTNGTVTLNPDGSFGYLADAGFAGTDSFTYQVTAAGLTSNVATVALTVAFPRANDDAYTLPAGGMPLVVPTAPGVLANDDVPAGQPFAVVLDAAPTHGTLALAADGSFSYFASPAYNGADDFTYHFTSGSQTSNTATVTLLVGLVGVPDAYTVQHDDILQTDATSGVLANDSNPGGFPLTAGLLSGPTHGALAFSPDGSFTYTPTAGYVGADSFTYEALAGGLSSGPVLVSIDVQDRAPNAPNATYAVHAGQPLSGVLGQIATDPDIQDTLTFVLDAGPVNGQVQFGANGTFSYQANQGFVGTDTFRYHTNDGALSSPTSGTVTITVTDAAPLAGNVSFDVAQNGVLNSPANNVLSNTTDTDGDAMAVRLLTHPAKDPQFVLNPNGTFVYTPAAGFTGTDTFTFVANDGTLDSNVATVTIHVSATAMVFDHTYVLPATGALVISPSDGLLDDAFNPSGVQLDPVVIDPPVYGTVQVDQYGGFVYTPAAGAPHVDDSFTFGVQLPGGAVAMAHAFLVAKQPVISLERETFTAFSGGKLTGNVLAITPDDGGNKYPTSWSANDPTVRNPFALLERKKYNLVDQFWINDPNLIANRLGNLTFSPLGYFTWLMPAHEPPTLAGHILTVSWNGLVAPFGASVNDKVDVNWSIGGISSASVAVQNTALHQIYVLAGLPTSNATLFHTVVRVGTLAAEGLAATTDVAKLQISAKIVKAFQSLNIIPANPSVLSPSLFSGLPQPVLTYYADWDVGAGTTDTLLKTGDGDCNAWRSFFIDVVTTQGVTVAASSKLKILVKSNSFTGANFPFLGRSDQGPFMLVKGWVLKAGAKASNLYVYDPQANKRLVG